MSASGPNLLSHNTFFELPENYREPVEKVSYFNDVIQWIEEVKVFLNNVNPNQETYLDERMNLVFNLLFTISNREMFLKDLLFNYL